MSLVRLLSAGKSLVGGMDNPTRYRMGEPGMLPKFGSRKNPFQAAQEQRPKAQAIQPPEPSAAPLSPVLSRQDREGDTPLRAREALLVPRAPALSPPVATARQWRESDGERERGGASEKSSPNWGTAFRSVSRGWLEAVKARIPRGGVRAARSAGPSFMRPPVQTELSLDNIKVMRNDLSDMDLEVIPLRPAPVRSEKGPVSVRFETAMKAGSGAVPQPSPRLSGRPYEAQSPEEAAVRPTTDGERAAIANAANKD